MWFILHIFLWIIAATLTLPLAVFGLECLLAVLTHRVCSVPAIVQRPHLAILVPAHNEAPGIAATLHNIQTQLRPNDRLIVIADNCTDQTATVARQCDPLIEVLERHDPDHRGKGFALAYGVDHLRSAPVPEPTSTPEIVIIIDADCQLAPGALDALAVACLDHAGHPARPAQAVYLMDPPPNPTPRDYLSTLAFLFKNQVRPLGLHVLAGPCLLTGTGMAFPWQLLAGSQPITQTQPSLSLATANIVEDMQLGLDLAHLGHPPYLCPHALVTGQLPSASAAVRTQRQRWEHGHLHTLLVQAPRLLLAGLVTLRPTLFLLGLELSVPPLSLLVTLWGVGLCVTLVGGWLAQSASANIRWGPLVLLLAAGLCMLLGVVAGWVRFARKRVPGRVFLLTPLYILWKVPMYIGFLFHRQRSWIRTARN